MGRESLPCLTLLILSRQTHHLRPLRDPHPSLLALRLVEAKLQSF